MVRQPSSQDLGPVSEIDWTSWRPDDVATLLFIVDEVRVLLIRKKRGLGAGKINGPGGRLEPGETPLQAAIREVEEEIGVTPLRPEPRGVLSFEFTNGYKLRAHLFVAREFEGSLRETDEATPIWFARDALPFEEMWSDDALWLPHVLGGRSVTGYFVFEGETMLGSQLEFSSIESQLDSKDAGADAALAHSRPSRGRSLIVELPRRMATRRLAARLAALLQGGDLVILSGPLGSGKTFFARALCGSLGVEPRRVTSPTFSLVHEFDGRLPIAHADLYRLGGELQLRELGLDALRDDGRLLLVEWGAPYAAALGGDALIVSFCLEPRRAELSAQGHRSREILQAFAKD